jgi:hypothetical protein
LFDFGFEKPGRTFCCGQHLRLKGAITQDFSNFKHNPIRKVEAMEGLISHGYNRHRILWSPFNRPLRDEISEK